MLHGSGKAEVTISAVVKRADGRVENLGVIVGGTPLQRAWRKFKKLCGGVVNVRRGKGN